MGIFAQVDVLGISYGSCRVDSHILLGMNVGSPGHLLVDIVAETVKQRYKESW
jgi:hypothetical protein